MIRSTPLPVLLAIVYCLAPGIQAHDGRDPKADGVTITGHVTDPQGNAMANAEVQLVGANGEPAKIRMTDDNGYFKFSVPSLRNLYAEGECSRLSGGEAIGPGHVWDPDIAEIRLDTLAVKREAINVTADVKDRNVLSPDPAQRVNVRQETLDANPGRPGAPISIPGLPIETASGGIKAPQYFSPGVAGDHGEPIAQYIQVGTYLVSNNLSANAHGNGYARS